MGETVCRTIRRLGTGSRAWRARTAADEEPVKGGCPLSISYSVHARLYWSVRPSITAPPACSGLMYCGVPTTMPLWVSCCRAGGVQRARDAEVEDDRVSSGQHDVVGLDVAVDDAVLVGVLQGAADFAGDLKRGVERELRFARRGVAAATRPRRTA